ncbi:MAG TPA: hypothetical protein VGK59_12865 [Ohtaekwangia sp.]
MKILIDKGYQVMQYLMISGAAMLLSCEDDREVNYSEDKAIELEVTDSYLQVETPVVGFQAGTPSYSIAFNAINGLKDLDKVNIYSTFTDTSGVSTNEVLFASYDVEEPLRNVITDEFTYDDLKAGLLLEGEPLPDDQILLAVGAGWEFRFEGVRADGEIIRLPGTINVAVLSRFAGIYKMTKMAYYRIGVLRNDVTDPEIGETIFIGSVDENTFSHNGWWGPFPWPGCAFNFDIDLEDADPVLKPVTAVPILTECGLYAGNEPLACPGMSSVPCATSNVLEIHDDTGKHILKLSYGYLVTSGATGPREFYVEYEKVP